MASENSGRKASSHDDDIYRQVDGVNIRVSGLREEDVFTRDGVYKEITNTLGKLMSAISISDCTLNVKRHHETGGRRKYSARISIVSDIGGFRADDHEWSIFKAVRLALEKLEREVFRKEGRTKVHARAP